MVTPSYLRDSRSDEASLNSETLAFLLANPAAALATLSQTTAASGDDACWEASETPGRGFREPRRLRAPGGGSCGLQLAVAEQLDQLQREERLDECERRDARDCDLGTRGGATGEQRETGRYDQFERAARTDDTCPPHARPSPLLSLAPDFREFRAGGRGGGVFGDDRSAGAPAADHGRREEGASDLSDRDSNRSAYRIDGSLFGKYTQAPIASQHLVDGIGISNSGDASGSRGEQNVWSPSISRSRSGNERGFGGKGGMSMSGGTMAPPPRPASAAIGNPNATAAAAAPGGAAGIGGAALGSDDVAHAGDSTHRDPLGTAAAGQAPRGSRSKSVGQMQAARILQALEHGARERVKRRRTQQKHLEHLQVQQQQEEGQGQEQQQGGLHGFALLTSPLSVSSTPPLAPTAAPLHTTAHAAPHAAQIPLVPIGWGHAPPAPVAEAWGGAQGRSEGEAERRRREQERVAFDWSEKGPRSHSEAEKRRRERINQQLGVLRALLPGASMGKADKASVLAEAVAQLRALRAGLGESCGEEGEGEDEREKGQQGSGKQEGAEEEAGEGQRAEVVGEEGAERAERAAGAAAGFVASSLLACGKVPEATPREDDAVEVHLVWAHVEEGERGDEVGEEVREDTEEQGEVDRKGGEGLAGRKRRRGSEGERAVCVCIWSEDGDGLLPAIQTALKVGLTPYMISFRDCAWSRLPQSPCASHATSACSPVGPSSHFFSSSLVPTTHSDCQFPLPSFPCRAHSPSLCASPASSLPPVVRVSLTCCFCTPALLRLLLPADTGPAASLASAPVAPDFEPGLAARPPGAAPAAAIGAPIGAPGSSAAAATEQEQQQEGVHKCGEDVSWTRAASGEGGVAQYVREVRAAVVDVMARWRRGEMVRGGVRGGSEGYRLGFQEK
ncbi:unnamed protein product [Closterium sp. NIES-65]|nr:unnamed protein product [Closterium sp. NIES-65]